MSQPVDLIGLLVVSLAVSCAVVFLLGRLRLPPVVGYLCSGIVLGPTLGLISQSRAVSTLAEIGVLLLMFTIGLEFDTRYFLRIKRVALGGGLLQIVLTILAAVGAGLLLGWPLRTSLFLGCIVALSSTAVVTIRTTWRWPATTTTSTRARISPASIPKPGNTSTIRSATSTRRR